MSLCRSQLMWVWWWVSMLFVLPLVFADQSQAGLPGFCALGGESIVTTDPVTHRKHPSPDYRELACVYSNGQHARVPVCVHHFETYTATDYPTLWDSIKRGWASEMGAWSREKRERYWHFYEGVEISSCGGE